MSNAVAVENATADRLRTPRLIMLLTPGMIIVLVSLILPVAWLFRMSFNLSIDGGIIREGFTLHHYVAFLTDGFRLGIAWNSLLLSSIVTLFHARASPIRSRFSSIDGIRLGETSWWCSPFRLSSSTPPFGHSLDAHAR